VPNRDPIAAQKDPRTEKLDREGTRALAARRFQCYAADHADEAKRGQLITRQHRCECGREFTQMILSATELAAAERLRIVELIARQIPDFWLPVHCPPCERKDLSRQARIDDLRPDTPTLRPAP
jgi:hypothetical protein